MTTNQFEEVDAIEKAYPEAYKLARQFHELYEEYAPQFGYETRKDTKEFDPKSNNGRLMAKVCYEVVHTSITKALREQEAVFLNQKSNAHDQAVRKQLAEQMLEKMPKEREERIEVVVDYNQIIDN